MLIDQEKVEALKKFWDECQITSDEALKPIKAITTFTKNMEKKLIQNGHKGNRNSWLHLTYKQLFDLLNNEIDELIEAIWEQKSEDHIIDECADVANFAMMIADVARENKIFKEKIKTKTSQFLPSQPDKWKDFFKKARTTNKPREVL